MCAAASAATSTTTTVDIRVEKKYAKMDSKIQAQNIGDQISLLLYGKRLVSNQSYSGGVLGQKQSIRMSNVSGKTIQIHIPPSVAADDDTKTIMGYIRSMINHAKSREIDIYIVDDD